MTITEASSCHGSRTTSLLFLWRRLHFSLFRVSSLSLAFARESGISSSPASSASVQILRAVLGKKESHRAQRVQLEDSGFRSKPAIAVRLGIVPLSREYNHCSIFPFKSYAWTQILKDASKRKRRTKELESVLGASLCDGRIPQRTTEASNWDIRLEELKEFKAIHGHCRVPRSFESLYDWLVNQRNGYLNPNSPNCVKDASERERRTTELDSVLGASLWDRRFLKRTIESSKWDARLEELKKFKAKHWHCRLPTSCGSLYRWRNNQRGRCLNPNSPHCLKDVLERERRTKELESVLGESLWDSQIANSKTQGLKSNDA